MKGVRGRVAGRETVGNSQKPHTEKSKVAYEALAAKVWAQIGQAERVKEGK